MDETSQNVYRENVELIDTLRSHKQELDEFQKLKDYLSRLIATTNNEKELNEILIKEKVEQILKQNNQIKEFKDKIQLLENSLTQFINEFDL